jgi:hypothetical protein
MLVWLTPRMEITEANCKQVEIGMTKTRVEKILGGPPRSESSGEIAPVCRTDANDEEIQALENWFARIIPFVGDDTWASDECVIVIVYDEDDCVLAKEMTCVRRVRPSLLGRILSWWHR